MAESVPHVTVAQTAAILYRYGFELRGYTAQELIHQWIANYSSKWIRLAVVEALYQGRYKAISVEHILKLWLRRGEPTFHFTHEFERLISRNLPQSVPPSVVNSLTESDSMEVEPNPSNSDRDRLLSSLEALANFNVPNLLTPLEIQEKSLASQGSESLSHNDISNPPQSNGERSIHEFTPLPDSSEFYSKLQAVIHQEMEAEDP